MTSTARPPLEAQDLVSERKPGGQPGNSNRLKTGRYTKRNRKLRHEIENLKRRVRHSLLLAEAARDALSR